MTPRFTCRQAITDPALLGAMLAGESWSVWRTLLIAAMGEALTADERETFRRVTGRPEEPGECVDELWCVIGRRGGKSRAMAVLAAYLSGLCDHPSLVPGERGVVLMIAPDQRQAAIALNYAAAGLEASPLMAPLVRNKSWDSLVLDNGISIQVRASNFRTLRGSTLLAVLADEAAFWRSDESANPDTEILNAVRPGLATTGGPLIVASSPYAKRGELYRTYRQNYGPGGDPSIIVAKGPSRTFNPSLPQSVVDRAMERDPASASAEYLGEFRSDIESYISREAVEAVTSKDVRERAPVAGVSYSAFTDPSGGASDAFTLAVAHREGDRAVVDCLREVRPPFSPESVVAEFAKLLRTYHISNVRGDRYAGLWPGEQFKKRGIEYWPARKAKSDLYRELVAPINSGQVDLIDNDRLTAQLCSLERRTARSGKDSIDHAPGGHDDLANVCAGVVHLVLSQGTHEMTAALSAPVIFADGRRVAGPRFLPEPHFPPPWQEPEGEQDDAGHTTPT